MQSFKWWFNGAVFHATFTYTQMVLCLLSDLLEVSEGLWPSGRPKEMNRLEDVSVEFPSECCSNRRFVSLQICNNSFKTVDKVLYSLLRLHRQLIHS